MSIQLYPSIAKVKRNGVYQNLPGFVQPNGDNDAQAMIANAETSTTAQYDHPAGSYFRLNGILYQVNDDANIRVNDTIAVGTNCHVAVLADDVWTIQNEVGDQYEHIVEVSNSIDDVKSDLYGSASHYVETNLSSFCTKYSGYNFAPGTQDSVPAVSGAPNSSFDSYCIFVPKNTTLYIDASLITYYSCTIGVNPVEQEFTHYPASNAYIVKCETSSRVRKSEGNLPSAANPLTVNAGTVLAFTVTAGTTPKVFLLTDKDELAVDRVITTIDETSVKIKGTSYEVLFSKLSTAQGYQWNITSLTGKSGVNMFPAGVDIVGVIQFVGGSNFMGGGHGNESNYEFRVMADGDDLTGIGSYNEIHVIMNSHLYNPDSTSDNVVDRFVEFVFTADGWSCRNTFKVLVNAEIQVAYCSGLFAFKAEDCDGAYSNIGSLNLQSTSARQLESTEFKEITINLPDDFTLNISSETGDKGFVAYRSNTQSFKVYFANAEVETVSANTYISGLCKYRF